MLGQPATYPRAYPRAGGGLVALKPVICRECSHILCEAAPGTLVRMRCRNRRCGTFNVVEVTDAGLIRTRLE